MMSEGLHLYVWTPNNHATQSVHLENNKIEVLSKNHTICNDNKEYLFSLGINFSKIQIFWKVTPPPPTPLRSIVSSTASSPESVI